MSWAVVISDSPRGPSFTLAFSSLSPENTDLRLLLLLQTNAGSLSLTGSKPRRVVEQHGFAAWPQHGFVFFFF